MSQPQGTPAGDDFDQKLAKLRMRIDLLPPGQRAHLAELADVVDQQHRRLQHRTSDNHDAH